MKRICIYLTYDPQKVVDRYIGYMLKELKLCVDYLVIVCNETEIIKGKEILEQYSDEIFCRENIGFDAGGFKDALCKFLGWDKVLFYDELVLVNDSMFGPFCPMKKIFDKMERTKVDFWGLIKHAECIHVDMGYIPEHIQSFFFTIRFRMLHTSEFRKYWEKLPYFETFHQTVVGHEIKFTQHFASLGYTYAALAETEINDSINIKNNFSQYCVLSYELIKKRNFPFLKKQQIILDNLNDQTQENLRLAIDYIDKETNYDVNLIWDNIIRSFDMAQLQRKLHFQYIIHQRDCRSIHSNSLILIFIAYKESAEYILEYLKTIDKQYSIKIISDTIEKVYFYQKAGYEVKICPSENYISLLREISGYDYVCVLHDTDLSSDRRSNYLGKSYLYHIWENLLKNQEYITGILDLFSNESRLGFITCPQPNFGPYFEGIGKGWNGNYNSVANIARELNLNCQISEKQPPFRVTDNFWIRGKILKKLNELKRGNDQYLPYLWSYIAQDAGYYSGIVESPEYASMNEVNLQYYLQEITRQISDRFGKFKDISELKKNILVSALEKYCKSYRKVLIYGAGKAAEEYRKYIANAECYIVSDGQKKQEKLDELPIKYLSEILEPEEYGIVLCLNEKNQKEVIPILENRKIYHYFCL